MSLNAKSGDAGAFLKPVNFSGNAVSVSVIKGQRRKGL